MVERLIETHGNTEIKRCSVEVETKDFIGTLGYVEITTSGVNCVLKNSRGGKSRSEKGY